MQTIEFEPMSVGRILDRAFAIYRNNFLRFVTIVAIIEVPLALLAIVSSSWTQTKAAARQPATFERALPSEEPRAPARRYDPSSETPSILGLVGMVVGTVLRLVGSMLCQAALIKNVSEVYLGHEITVGDAYRFALPKALTLLLAAICVGFVVGLGFLLLIVPGVIFALWFALTTPAIVVEGHSTGSAMSRSKALVAGNLGKVFAVGFLTTLLFYPVWLPLNYLFVFVGRALAPDSATLVLFMRYFASTISQILVLPISAAATILLYYDLRIRKEGFDLQMLAQSMASGQGEVSAA